MDLVRKDEMKINSFEKKEEYKKIRAKKRNELDNVDLYLKEIVRFDNKDKLGDIIEKIKKKELKKQYVWALFGKINNKDEVCLQVGAGIDIENEIISDISEMYCEDESINKSNKALETKSKNTQFYKNVYNINAGDDKNKNKYIYRKVRKEYEELIFYYIDIDIYLGIKDFKCENKVVNNILDLSKMYYAETMFAYETQAIYWNVFRSGVGVETLKLLLNKEKEHK